MVIAESGNVTVGRTLEATYCDGNRRWPVRVKRINAQTLVIEAADLRDIVSVVSEDATTSFGVGPGRKMIGDSVRHARLAKASDFLRKLAAALTPLTTESEAPGLASEGLGLLFNFLAQERERASSRSSKSAA
jgi:hypothetical protein